MPVRVRSRSWRKTSESVVICRVFSSYSTKAIGPIRRSSVGSSRVPLSSRSRTSPVSRAWTMCEGSLPCLASAERLAEVDHRLVAGRRLAALAVLGDPDQRRTARPGAACHRRAARSSRRTCSSRGRRRNSGSSGPAGPPSEPAPSDSRASSLARSADFDSISGNGIDVPVAACAELARRRSRTPGCTRRSPRPGG